MGSRRREKNSQCRMTMKKDNPAAGGKGVNENNTFLSIFRLKFLLKNIFLISSIMQNG